MRPGLTRYFLLVCIFMLAGYTAGAQNASRIYVEPDGWGIGTECGLSDLWGDIGTKSFITHYTNSKYFDKVAFLGGMFGRYSVHPCFGIRLQMNYGALYATDKWNYDGAQKATTEGDDAYQRYARAQNVKDDVFEGTVLMEYLPFRSNPESRRAEKRGQPVLLLGFGLFHFTPYSTVANSTTFVKIHDLDLEGQGWASKDGVSYPKQYKLTQPCIPFGLGYRWDLGQHLNLGIEYVYRYCFTDYLDGVSGKYVDPKAYAAHLNAHDAQLAQLVADKGYYQGLEQPNTAGNMRGNPSNKDAYSTLTITFYYKVPTRNARWWR